MRKTYFTCILSNKSRRVYVGSTSELQVSPANGFAGLNSL
jgi:hypothetical protein